jgi:hypothetical protein
MSADLAHCFVGGDQCVGDLRVKARWRAHFRSGGVSNRFRPKSRTTRCAAGEFSQIPQPLLGVREADAMAAERCAMGGPPVAASWRGSRRYRPCRACHSIVAPDGSPLVSSERKAIEVADLVGSELHPDFLALLSYAEHVQMFPMHDIRPSNRLVPRISSKELWVVPSPPDIASIAAGAYVYAG